MDLECSGVNTFEAERVCMIWKGKCEWLPGLDLLSEVVVNLLVAADESYAGVC